MAFGPQVGAFEVFRSLLAVDHCKIITKRLFYVLVCRESRAESLCPKDFE